MLAVLLILFLIIGGLGMPGFWLPIMPLGCFCSSCHQVAMILLFLLLSQFPAVGGPWEVELAYFNRKC